MTTRRHFIKQTAQATAAMAIPGAILSPPSSFYKISLAQFSLAPSFFSKKMDTLDFPAKAKNDFGIEAVEYVSMFFKDKVSDCITFFFTENSLVGKNKSLIAAQGIEHNLTVQD